MSHTESIEDRPRRRGADSIVGQVKSLWPILVMCCVGYAAWEKVRSKTEDNTITINKTVDDVNILKQTCAVQTAMLLEIKDVVKDIARSQRRRSND